MRPRIVVDGRMVGPIPHGFSRYLTNMARGLLELQESVTLPYELVFLVSKETPASAFGGFGTVETGAPFLSPLELLEIPVVLRRLNAALYHSPTFSSFPGFTLPCPWVATVHDLNHLRFGSASKRLYYRWLLKPFARKAAALLTVSDFSRRELSAWSGVAETAIEVVHNSLDEAYGRPLPDEAVRPVLERFGLEPGKYFFCLSNPKPHKNLALLVDAHAAYHDSAGTNAWPLVVSIAGPPGTDPREGAVRRAGPLADPDARALLTGAGAVVFPSLYEGFGLPPVEAAVSGVPVVVSKIPPHQEGLAELKAGEVLWVEASDRNGWIAALGAATRGELARPSLESRSKTIARFNTERMGRNMDRIYRRVLGLKA